MEAVVSKEIAEKDLNAWLDFQDVADDVREIMKSYINIILRGMQSGKVVIDTKTMDLTQKLKNPFGKEYQITKLKFKSTGLSIDDVERNKESIPAEFQNRDELAHIAVATGEPFSVLKQMSTKDLNTSIAIIFFFIA